MAFREGLIAADGFAIRYMEAGDGPPLVHLHGAGGLRLTAAHDLLARTFRVIAFEMPGFGATENRRTETMAELGGTMAAAARALGLDRFNLMGTSFGGTVALFLATRHPDAVSALVLEAPAAIRPESGQPVSGTPAEIAALLYAHPERMPPPTPAPPHAMAFARRLRGPGRDAALEAGIARLTIPVLVLLGTLDRVIPPSAGRIYKDLLPESHLMFVYDAGHAIAAERPEAFHEAVADFLERRDAFVISRSPTILAP